MQPIVNIGISAARKAGDMIIRQSERLDKVRFDQKSHNDFVSTVDIKAEQIITETILTAYPDHQILGEEGGASHTNPNAEYTWIIDPLDGTTNFLHGFAHYAVSIAVKQQDKIVHGIIYDPVRQELFTATKGKGAQLNNRRIRVSQCQKFESALLGTGFPFKNPEQLPVFMRSFETLFPKVSGIRRAGAAALDLAYVAAGRLDGFWEQGLAPWDMAAGLLLIKEAGGMISDYSGAEKSLENGEIIAGNPKIFKQLLQTLHPIVKQG